MNTIRSTATRDPFNRFVVISFGLHICLIVFFTVRAFVFPSDPIEIRSAIRVDMVALPDKEVPKTIPSEAAPPTPKKAPVVEKPKEAAAPVPEKVAPQVKVPDPRVSLKKTKAEQQEALNRLKAMQAIEKLKAKKKDAEGEAAPTEFKGNVLSEGNSLTGLSQIEFDRYLSDIENKIRAHWDIPKWLEDANLRAQVRVMIDERGYIVKKTVETSSGNESFDDAALSTLEKSSPLPPPPDRLKNVLATRGFVLNFPK